MSGQPELRFPEDAETLATMLHLAATLAMYPAEVRAVRDGIQAELEAEAPDLAKLAALGHRMSMGIEVAEARGNELLGIVMVDGTNRRTMQ